MSYDWDTWRPLGLPPQLMGALVRNGLSPDQVRNMTDDELLTFRNVGAKAIKEIRRVLPRETIPTAAPPVPAPPNTEEVTRGPTLGEKMGLTRRQP